MSLALSQSLALTQKFSLNQALLLRIPINYLDLAIKKASENPDLATEIFENIRRNKVEGTGNGSFNSYGFAAAKLSGSYDKMNHDGSLNGGNVVLGGLEMQVDKQMHLPDVEFRAISEHENQMIFMDHFSPKVELRLELVPKKIQSFIGWLTKERNWMADTISKAYNQIRKVQAPFIYSLNPRKLNLITTESISRDTGLNYHFTTIGRLLKDRYVRIVSPEFGRADCLPVSNLLVSGIGIFAYAKIPAINSILAREFQEGSAFSSIKIAREVGGMAGRTVRQYLSEAEIPCSNKRQQVYNSGAVKPYRIATKIEPFLDLSASSK